jgi:hypothetical protein
LWLKADMLAPGETVTVYSGQGVNMNRLLVSTAQRGRAFLGTVNSRSALQPGPARPRDEMDENEPTQRQHHSLAVPSSPNGPGGPTQRDFQPAA